MDFEFDVNMKPNVLYDYLLQHSYKQAVNILATALGFFGVFYGCTRGYWAAAVLGAILIVYLPLSLLRRAYMQAKMTPGFQKPLHYRMTEEGVVVSQGEIEEQIVWENCLKAISTKQSIILYTDKRSAFIFPRKDLGDRVPNLIQMISTHMPPNKVKIRE